MKLFSLIILISFNCLAQFRGHHREIATTFYPEGRTSSDFSQFVHNSRLDYLFKKSEYTFEIAYDLFINLNWFEEQNIQNSSFKYRYDDIELYLKEYEGKKDSYQVLQNLDRLNLTYQKEKLKLVVGRQMITPGIARFVNPLDILVPFDFLMINLEQRLGVDAIKLSFETGNLSDLEIITVANKGSKNLNILAYSDNWSETDYKAYLMQVYNHNIYGIELQSSFYDIGTWFEYGAFFLKNGTHFNRYSIGGSYYFSNELSFMAEYHFNGAGTSDETQYLVNFSKSFQKELAIFLLAKDYLNLGLSYPVSPLLGININIFSNLNDHSMLLSPSFEYSLYENWYVSGMIFAGVNGKSNNSEFANYPTILSVSLKYFY